jgi:membrane-bound lytic murein transglycosylase D
MEALVIPVPPAAAPSAARSARYRTRKGDTLITIADRFGVTVDQLRRWNHVRGTTVAAGNTMYVAEPAHITRASGRRNRKGHHAATARQASSAASRGSTRRVSAHASNASANHAKRSSSKGKKHSSAAR